jgi:hypothetical protein
MKFSKCLLDIVLKILPYGGFNLFDDQNVDYFGQN